MAYDGKVLARARDRYETEKERRRADSALRFMPACPAWYRSTRSCAAP